MMRSTNIRFNVTHTGCHSHNNCRAINLHITCFYPPFNYSNRPLDRVSLRRCRRILFWLERHRLQKGKISVLGIFVVFMEVVHTTIIFEYNSFVIYASKVGVESPKRLDHSEWMVLLFTKPFVYMWEMICCIWHDISLIFFLNVTLKVANGAIILSKGCKLWSPIGITCPMRWNGAVTYWFLFDKFICFIISNNVGCLFSKFLVVEDVVSGRVVTCWSSNIRAN